MSKIKFEEVADILDAELEKRRRSWNLEAIRYMDFDDVKQEIKAHVYTKFSKWDQNRPFRNWVIGVIHNQIINKKRNIWGNFVSPCSDCVHNLGGEECALTPSKKKSSECVLYADWQAKKKDGYEIKLAKQMSTLTSLPVSSQEHQEEVDVDKFLESLEECLRHLLEKKEITNTLFEVFKGLYIEKISENEMARRLGYATSEKKRQPGYKQINNHKRKLEEITRELLEKEDFICITNVKTLY